jgi:hypothetical protein
MITRQSLTKLQEGDMIKYDSKGRMSHTVNGEEWDYDLGLITNKKTTYSGTQFFIEWVSEDKDCWISPTDSNFWNCCEKV